MSFNQWVDTSQEWNSIKDLQWIPHEDGPGEIFPVKNWITNTKVPYRFITENQEHIFETKPLKYSFQTKETVYNFETKDDKYSKIT